MLVRRAWSRSRRTSWDQVALVDRWKAYLTNPHSYLRHIIDEYE
ncbi:MAG: hypothetical protein ACRDP8_03375 [Actinopolymorphaceae bacterium]